MEKKQLIDQLASQMNTDDTTAEKWADVIVESIYQSLKHREAVTLQGFGTFYIDE